MKCALGNYMTGGINGVQDLEITIGFSFFVVPGSPQETVLENIVTNGKYRICPKYDADTGDCKEEYENQIRFKNCCIMKKQLDAITNS